MRMVTTTISLTREYKQFDVGEQVTVGGSPTVRTVREWLPPMLEDCLDSGAVFVEGDPVGYSAERVHPVEDVA